MEEGQAVRKGQVLFIIDQVPYRAALQTAEANLEAARASVATAQLTYDSKKIVAPERDFRFDLQTSYNNLLTAKAQLAQTEAQRHKCRQQPLLYGSEKSCRRCCRHSALSCGRFG